jgi:hypothetical protein
VHVDPDLGRLGLVTAILVFGAARSFANELADCGHPVPDRSIRGCSLLIAQGGAASDKLAEAHLLRGAATITMGDFDSSHRRP